VDDGDERQLATVVDLGDLDLDLLAHTQDVLDVLDALALVELAQLRDVQQAVATRAQRHEGAEAHELDDRAQVALAHLRDLRVRDRVDRAAGGLRRRAVGGADEDSAVVLDADLRSRGLLGPGDPLALGPAAPAARAGRAVDGGAARRWG